MWSLRENESGHLLQDGRCPEELQFPMGRRLILKKFSYHIVVYTYEYKESNYLCDLS